MTDEALVWKFAFGALVLLFCGVAFVARQPPEPAAQPAAAIAPAPTPPVVKAPLPAASEPPVVQEPMPTDVPEAQEAPVRIRISLREPPPVDRPRAARPHKSVRHVAVKHAGRTPPHHVKRHLPVPAAPSAYTARRPHYPFDPRERWRSREAA